MNYKVKIALIGDFSIGKSSLLETYVNENEKTAINATIGVDFRHSIVHRENYTYKLHLWDTAGQEKFQAIVTSYFRDLDVAVLVYDCTDMYALENLPKWDTDLDYINEKKNCVKFLVANKIDSKHRIIDTQAGKEKACFAVTEPDVGLDTTKLKTKATPDGNGYIVNGTKVWTSTAQVAKKVLLLTRTTDVEDVRKPTEGLTLFYTDLDRESIEIREIDKMGRKAVDTNMLFIDGLKIPIEDRIGEEGMGFRYILDGMNPERILIAAEAIGIGRAALNRATQYAKDRVVFGRPIGKNQGIQHPLAKCWAELEAANLITMKAAALFDSGQPCGPEANAAKYLAAEAGFEACQTAIMTHGGFGYAKEYQVERYLREVMIARIAPISPQLVLSFLAEKVLGLPKSY